MTDPIVPRVRIGPLIGAVILLIVPFSAHAFELFDGLFEKDEISATVWQLKEQYVRLVKSEKGSEPSDHPILLERLEVEQALASLQLWVEGGVLRDEEATTVYPRKQAALISRYVTDALKHAEPDDDVIFNVRGYTDVMLSLAKEREWTTGRVFFKDGKLNLIIGEYQKRIDKAQKQVEASFGIIDDFRDVYFQPGSRKRKGKMPGRIITTEGVELYEDGKIRPDWVMLEVAKAAEAYREAQTPVAIRKEELKAKAEAAKLTIERRQMREEMARMRKEIKNMQSGPGSISIESLETRLANLQDLHTKGLITDDEFKRRKEEILQEL